MYKISVPFNNNAILRNGREEGLEDLKKCGASRVFLALDPYLTDETSRREAMLKLKDNCNFFKSHGYEVGAWIWTFLTTGDGGFARMRSIDNSERDCCPLDENFRKFVGGYLMDIARCGVDMIMFDDDFRFSYRPGIHCVCDRHMELICQKLGEDISAAELAAKMFCGGRNKYRDAFMEVNGETLRSFASEMRGYVNMVDPGIRLGLCACMSTWDTDGVDAATLSRILAGDTKPFLRLVGAPYWVPLKAWDNRLQNVVEIERMERAWCGEGIEIFCEGDTFPRPRHKTPACYLELFDTAMRADGTTDGILKYMEDYYSSPSYEKGYVTAHIRNKELYDTIDRLFGGKTACGIRVYEKLRKLADTVIPKEAEGKHIVGNMFFSIAGRMISDSSIPSVYEGDGVCGIAFGENVTALTEDQLKKGVIIDAEASRILRQRGIDTGIVTCGEKVDVTEEYFVCEDEYIRSEFKAYLTTLKGTASVQSYLVYDGGKKAPLSYYYQNSLGYRFIVFNFDTYYNGEDIYRSYFRSRQIAQAPQIFGAGKLPAYCFGHPDLYIMCKKNDHAMTVGLWNMFADPVYEPVIELDDEYEVAEFVNCSGKIEENKVFLSDIMPFSFVCFEVI